MTWMLFLDESGHDHKTMPYEIHGGISLHTSRLWPLISAVMTLEQSTFGVHLHEYGSELKGQRLLCRDRFKWNAQGPQMDAGERRKHVLNFLGAGTQPRAPRFDDFTAYGQACLAMAEGILHLLTSHDARLFASIIPCVERPSDIPADMFRKDLIFLLERYFYFLDERQEMGLLVMDGSESVYGKGILNW